MRSIFEARYGGLYENPIGGSRGHESGFRCEWVATRSHYLDGRQVGENTECDEWFDEYRALCGFGMTPQEALEDFAKRVGES